ncbi:hypothetical protein WN943_027698 [Citrus x changshan-huyou]
MGICCVAKKTRSANSIAKIKTMGISDFTALDISSCKTACSSAASNLRNNCPIKTGKKYPKGSSSVYHLLLLISALLSTTTFHIQLKILGCRAEDACEYNSSSLSPFCQIANQHPYFIQSVVITYEGLRKLHGKYEKGKGHSCVWALQYNFQDASKIQWDVYAIT